MNTEAWQATAAWVAIGLAFGGFLVGLVTSMRARVRDLESVYFERYWQIIDRFDYDALTTRQPETPRETSKQTKIDEACVLYLRLCEEELRMREAGLVSAATWCRWKKGMAFQLKEAPVRETWQALQTEGAERAGGGECRSFRLLRKHGLESDPGGAGDPLTKHRFLGWLRGALPVSSDACKTCRGSGKRPGAGIRRE